MAKLSTATIYGGLTATKDIKTLGKMYVQGNEVYHMGNFQADASQIIEDITRRFVTDAEKTSWNGKAAGNHVHGSVTNDGKIGTTANLVIMTTTGGALSAKAAGTTAQYLRGDGSWATPPDTNTTYTAGNGITLTTTTFSVVAGNGLVQDAGGLSLGTPGTLTASSANALTTASHTHQITGFLPLTGGSLSAALTIQSTGTIGGATVANGYLKVTDGTNTLGIDANEIYTTAELYLGTISGGIELRPASGAATVNGATIWTSANDGSGSGLDADTIDGIESTNLLTRTHVDVPVVIDVNSFGLGTKMYTGSGGSWTNKGPAGDNSMALLSMHTHSGNYLSQLWFDTQGDNFYHRSIHNGTIRSWAKVWTASNDGTGSGLDADLLDGMNTTSAATASTIVSRDTNADFAGRHITATKLYTTEIQASGVLSLLNVSSAQGMKVGSLVISGNYLNSAPTNGLYVSGQIQAVSGTASTNTTTGTIVVTGGVGISADVWAGGTINAATFNATSLTGGGFQGIDADTATQPSFTWTTDLDTGIYRPAADQVGVTTGGAVRLTITSTAMTTTVPLTVGGNLILGTQANKATITYATNTARTYTIPDAGANATFVMTEGAQTLNGVKTFGSTPVVPSLDISAVAGNGIRFWASNSFKIHMGNSAEYVYGPVSDFSIKMNMSSETTRGWVWGVTGVAPVAAMNTQGKLQLASDLYSLGNIGAGTVTPYEKIDVAGSARIQNENSLKFGGTGASDSKVSMKYNTTTQSLDFIFA